VAHKAIAAPALAVVIAGLSVTLAGCRQTANLAQQEVVVAFKPGSTQADHLRVYNACRGLAGIDPEPLVTNSKYQATLANNVRYRVDHASNIELQALYTCLGKDPSVVGYSQVEPGQ